ncbi:MAG: hypothetical protein V8T36_05310 [Ruthenibacterium lactatiformans]
MPNSSQEGRKDENVFLILNPDGSVNEQIVSDWLHSDTRGFPALRTRAASASPGPEKGRCCPRRTAKTSPGGPRKTMSTTRGAPAQTPPVTADITYTLDGDEITAEALLGQKRTPYDAPSR